MTLTQLNALTSDQAQAEFMRCCGSSRWASRMTERRPFGSSDELAITARRIWQGLSHEDWKEAFSHHPKIGDVASLREKFATTAGWAGREQAGVKDANESVLHQLAEGNLRYESKFGYIFIVCATGKSAGEMLAMLKARLDNDPSDEILIAAGEQEKITELRLKKLLMEEKG